MNTVLKKTFRGFLFGIAGSAAIYIVCFFIELFSFFKEYLSHTHISDDVIAGNSSNAGTSFTLADYTPFLGVWNWSMALLFFGITCFLGTVIGLIIGCINNSNRTQKIKDYNYSVIEDGSKRQKILFANGVKTMAETLSSSCEENLFYMNNFFQTEYISSSENEAIMKELVKFIEYEQTIKDFIENNKKEGGR
ncbi:MAG: hypothetical protein ACI4J8_00590 [Oscillospiraceae bacterium]